MRRGRATVLRLHLTVALLAGAGLLLVSVSGAVLVFRPELDDLVFDGPVTVPPGGGRAPLEALLDAGQAAHPRLTPVTLTLPARDGQPARLRLERPAGEVVEVLLDPASARVRGSRWLERSPLHALRALHTELYLGGPGRVVIAALGLLLVLQGATGLFLWWPFTRRPRRGFTIRGGRRRRVLGYDLHKVIGIASLAFHVPVALTGALLALSADAGPPRPGAVMVRERDGSVAWLARAGGAPALVREPPRAGAAAWAAVAALHEGRFAGLASRWLYVAGGVTPVALALTGLGIWLGRPRRRRPLTLPSPQGGEGET
ncbi:MAG TPA: PepSY-associated TM helix domain-containing protein [Methylomirabilota bacterium]|nr:PepSY-associated TM helix domain-containing protein [Methylomirabilota bacterium]